MATSVDERFPPENMLDGKDSTFWMTTGMFPQEFVLMLRAPIQVSKITTLSLNVKKLSVEKCDQDRPESFEKVFEVELANRGDRLQTEVHQVNIKAKYLKFTLASGHGEFASVNRVSVVGESLTGNDGDDEDLAGRPLSGGGEGAATGFAAQGSFGRGAY